MRTFLIALPLAFLLLTGCTSLDGKPYDYTSINDHSLEFLRETHRAGVKETRKYLKEDLQFAERERYNRNQRRKGRAFAHEAYWKGEAENFHLMWADLAEEFRWDRKKIRHGALFGHLDTGDP